LASGRPTVRSSEEPVRVATAIERDAPMCHVEASIEQAMDGLDSRPGWQHCVVVNDAGVVVGLMPRGATGLTRPLVDVMRPGPTTIRPDEELSEAVAAMRKREIDERVVTDPAGRLLGVLRLPAD
jgi:CBS domain-containing protein